MNLTGFRAGAGRAEILFPADMFPTDNLYGVHDNPCARILVLDAGVRVAIAALEVVNAPDGVIHTARKNIEKLTQTPYDNIWVHVTHAITTPHQPGGPGMKPGSPPPPQPPKGPQDPDAPKKRDLFVAAIEKAVVTAATAAAESFGEASFGVGVGHCDVNVNRDIETPFGWWISQNPEEYSNKEMTILRVDKATGEPLAFLISYGLKPSAIDQSERKSPARKVSADVPGVACRMMEEAYGAPCLFCMSAAGDQVPREQAWYEIVLEDGTVGEVDHGVEKGYEIVERLGTEMGNDAIQIAAQISCTETETSISTASGCVSCDTRETKPGPPSPKKELEYKKDGSVSLSAEVIQMGDIAFVAVKPETNAITEKQLQEGSPFKHTLLISMVNGGMKYLPDQSAYDRVTWEAQRSMLMPGAAEKWVQCATDMLHNLKGD